MKFAKIPSTVALPTVIINSQKFSCTAGQWYFVFDRLMMTSSLIVVAVDAMMGYAVLRRRKCEDRRSNGWCAGAPCGEGLDINVAKWCCCSCRVVDVVAAHFVNISFWRTAQCSLALPLLWIQYEPLFLSCLARPKTKFVADIAPPANCIQSLLRSLSFSNIVPCFDFRTGNSSQPRGIRCQNG